MPDNIISEEEFLALTPVGEEEKKENIISEEEFITLGKSTGPTESSMDSGSESGSSVLLDRIETEDFGEEPKDEVEELKQIPHYYDKDKITPDPNLGYFPVDQDISGYSLSTLMNPTDQITNQISQSHECPVQLITTTPGKLGSSEERAALLNEFNTYYIHPRQEQLEYFVNSVLETIGFTEEIKLDDYVSNDKAGILTNNSEN